MDNNDKLKDFHGPLFSEGPWNCKTAACCDLCKTRSISGKKKHWAKNLCRSCYRRLSPSHRLYNDNWNQENSRTVETRKSSGKKAYKAVSPDNLEFDPQDTKTLLERYDFKCAYCKTGLQDHDHKAPNAFQVEYKMDSENTQLVPICRTCNCSKKNITNEEKLKKWCDERGMDYPVKLVTPPKKD